MRYEASGYIEREMKYSKRVKFQAVPYSLFLQYLNRIKGPSTFQAQYHLQIFSLKLLHYTLHHNAYLSLPPIIRITFRQRNLLVVPYQTVSCSEMVMVFKISCIIYIRLHHLIRSLSSYLALHITRHWAANAAPQILTNAIAFKMFSNSVMQILTVDVLSS